MSLDILGRNKNSIESEELKFFKENFPGNFSFISKSNTLIPMKF